VGSKVPECTGAKWEWGGGGEGVFQFVVKGMTYETAREKARRSKGRLRGGGLQLTPNRGGCYKEAKGGIRLNAVSPTASSVKFLR